MSRGWKTWWLGVVALVALGTSGERSFDLQGHRGARGLHPENTIEGFLDTLAIGVTTLEMDVGITRDGTVVVHHDEALNPDIARGAGGEWVARPTPLLRELSWEQLVRFDVGRLRPGSAYAARFPAQQGRDGIRVPRLADVLEAAERRAGGEIRYNVETKLSPDAPEATLDPLRFADAVVGVLRASGAARRATLQSFDWRTLRHVRRSAPAFETACLTTEAEGEDTIRRGRPGPSPWTAGLDVDDFEGSVPRLVKAAGCAVWSPDYRDLEASELALAHRLGLRVIPWTLNERVDIDAVLSLGVDGVISDHPDRVREAMGARGLPLPQAYGSVPSARRSGAKHPGISRSGP
jgi:glycerophosphoryl diester phosphodiesterase